MKLLAVCALVCAVVALSHANHTSGAAAPAVCQCPTAPPEQAQVPPEEGDGPAFARPPSNLTPIGQQFFYFNSELLRWHDAERHCASQGGHLASVSSKRQYNQIRKMIKKKDDWEPIAWIGGTDEHNEGRWKWTDGSPFKFKNWCFGEPSNMNNQDCLQMNYSGQKCWDDGACWVARPSVCAFNNTVQI
ncbi:type-2 ice-structuring protein-like [Cheilinus undulatus]|uniref:type-2 ice-structuring protein-like n=1 Tax=Cheilinus undulatus TaxID=241271 RepID=UPI001BD1D880|nr:type-2 ice-structuring protein-like [Cheilinus undulatus]